MKRSNFYFLLLVALLPLKLIAYDSSNAYWATNLPPFSRLTYWLGTYGNDGFNYNNWSNGFPNPENYAIVTVQEDGNYPVFYYDDLVGYLHIQPGARVYVKYALTIQHALVLESDNYSTGSIYLSSQSVTDPTQVLRTNRIILRRDFQPNEWTFFSVPATVNEFNIWTKTMEEFYPPMWGQLESPDVNNTMYVARYNGQKRFETGMANPESGLNWEQLTSVDVVTPNGTIRARQLLANEGYIILNPDMYQPNTTLFVIDDYDAIMQLVASSFTVDFVQPSYWNSSAGSDNPNANWNFKGAPFFGNYNLAYSYQQTGESMYFYQFDPLAGTYNVLDNTTDQFISSATPLFYQSTASAMTREARSLYCSLTDVGCTAAPVRAEHPDFTTDEGFTVLLELNAGGKSDRTRVSYCTNASAGFKVNEDAVKMISHIPNVPQLWSVGGGVRMAINKLTLHETQAVGIGLRLTESFPVSTRKASAVDESVGEGDYTLKLLNREQLTELKQLKLLDKFTGKEWNLLENDYTFERKGELVSNERFELTFEHRLITRIANEEQSPWRLISGKGTFYVEGLQEPAAITVFDSVGKKVMESEGVENRQLITLDPGVYLITVGTKTVKLIL